MLENDYGLVRSFQEGEPGVRAAIEWLEYLENEESQGALLNEGRERLIADHADVCGYVVATLLGSEDS